MASRTRLSAAAPLPERYVGPGKRALAGSPARQAAPVSQPSVQPAVGAAPVESSNRAAQIAVIVFLFTLTMPISFYLGGLRFSIYRSYIFIIFIPCLIMFLTSKDRRIIALDFTLLFYCLWSLVSLIFNKEPTAIQSSGILTVETMGSYLIGRCLIRNATDFRVTMLGFVAIVMFLLPFAALESVTKKPVLLEVYRLFSQTAGAVQASERLGLRRAQTSFEHPILYGTFVSAGLAYAYYLFREKTPNFRGMLGSAMTMLAVFFSLSTGAFVSAVMQFLMCGWDFVTRSIPKRWWIFFGIVASIYIGIDLLSTRTPAQVFITYLTFSSGSAYNRILIWEYGSAEVMRYPVFGIGFRDWERPAFVGASVDNFWLLTSMRYGMPAMIFIVIGLAALFWSIGRAQPRTEMENNCRKAFVIVMVGLCISATTVHLWNAMYCTFMFIIGSGCWMADLPRNKKSGKAATNPG